MNRTYWADLWVRSGWRVREHAIKPIAQLIDPAGRVVHRGAAADCLDRARRLAPPAGKRRGVVLMHGLNCSRRAMRRLETRLGHEGWAVANLSYPSTLRPIDAHVAQARGAAQALIEDGADSVAFIGHSLGGLIGRQALAGDWPGRRAVLIGPPNQGAIIAEWLAPWQLYHRLTGMGGRIVLPKAAAALAVPNGVEIGIIAGGTGSFGFNPLLGDDNDGTVRVAETRLDGAETDFRLVFAIHAVLASTRRVIDAAAAFVNSGGF